MVKIITSKKMLEEKLLQAQDEDLLELTFVPAQQDCGTYAPAFLHVTAIHKGGNCEDLESVDEIFTEIYVEEIA